MRNAHVDALEHSCSPIHLITGLGFEPKRYLDQYIIDCPACHNPLFVLPTGFLCHNQACNFRAGGVVDLLKWHHKLPDYTTALDSLLEILAHRFKDQAGIDDRHVREDMARLLTVRRRMLDFLLRAARTNPDTHAGVRAQNHLRKRFGEDVWGAAPYVAFPLWSKDYEEFKDILAAYESPPPLPIRRGDTPFLLPYFINHHTVGVVHQVLSPDKKTSEYFELEPRKYQFLGLLQTDPRANDFYLTHNADRAIIKNAEFARTDPSKMALALIHKTKFSDIAWCPKRVVYLEAKANNWSAYINLSFDTEVAVADSPYFATNLQSIEERITTVLYAMLVRDGEFSPTALTLLDLGQMYDEFVPRLSQMLKDGKHFELLKALIRHVRNKVLLVLSDTEKLIQTDQGYAYVVKNVTTYLTNFLLDIRRSISFPNSNDLYHEAMVVKGDQTFPVMFMHSALSRPGTLLPIINKPMNGKMPEQCINFNTERGNGIARLVQYFNMKVGESPMVEGIADLGWTIDRSKFYGPSWIADKDGIRYTGMVHHPDTPFLTLHYNAKENPVRRVYDQLPVECMNLIAQIIAMVFRQFHNVPLLAVPILRDQAGEVLLREMFNAIGQHSPVHYNESQWQRGKDTRGFPVYGTGCDYHRTKNLKQGVFMLTDRGYAVSTVYAQEDYERAGQTLREVMHSCIEWMLTGENVTFEYHRSVDPTCILSKEGKRIIERAMGLEWHIQTPAYNALDSLLSQIPFNRTHEYMVEDLGSQRFEVKLAGLENVDTTDLQLELKQFAAGVTLTQRGVAASIADMRHLLQTYYQDVPHVEQVFTVPTNM
jgi:hypothetical protein